MQQNNDTMVVAELGESLVELLDSFGSFIVGNRAAGAGKSLNTVAGQRSFFDRVHAPSLEAALLIDKQVVHHAAQPGAGRLDCHEFIELAVSLDQEFLEQVLGLGFAAGKAPCQSVQPIEVRPHKSLEGQALVLRAHSLTECNLGDATHKDGLGTSCYSCGDMKLLNELRRRRVFGTVVLYIVAAWIVIQAASLLFPALDIPDRAIRYVWIASALGFPVAVLFGWRFQVTSRGIFRTPPAAAGEGAPNLTLERKDILMLAGLVLLAATILVRAVQDIRRVDDILGFSAFGREILANSIAVLPLANLTGDDEQDFLVEGIHEAMTSTLSQISGLRVKSRTSTSTYRDTNQKVPEIASELGVANLIVGSVRRDDEMIRVTVELVDAASDEYLWTSTYETELRDLLAMQSNLARDVAREISIELTAEESARLAQAREVDPEVYETYLKGMFFVKQLEPAAIMKGMEYLHEAVAIDPREPLAYAGLALGYNTIGHGLSAHDAFPKAIAASEMALEIDEFSGEAWAGLAEAQLYYDWDWQTAEKSMQRALQLSPSLDHAYAHYAYLLMLLGREDEAIEVSERARDLSPVDPLWAGFTAWIYLLEGRWDDAIGTAEECLLFATSLDLCRYALGQVHSARGEFDKAVEVHEQIPIGDPFRNWSLGISYGFAGRLDEAQAVIDQMAVNATPRDQLHIALAYAAMGDTEKALQWINVSYESRSDWLPWVVLPNAYGGAVEPLRDEPGFQAIVDQMQIPAAQR